MTDRTHPDSGRIITSGAVPVEFLRGVIALCTQWGYSPENIEAWSTDDKWIADLWRQAAQMLAAAPAQPAAQQGAAYAATPTSNYAGRVYEEGFLIGTCPLYTADQLRAFADATCALRVESLAAAYCEELDKLSQRNYELRLASHGQAPAGATEPTEQQILEAAEKAGLWPNTVHSWIPAFHRYHKELAKAQPAQAQADSVTAPASVLHLAHSAFAEIAMAFPKAYALHKVGIADTAVREALAAPAAQADSQPAPDEIINMAREQGLPETETEGVFIVNVDDLGRIFAAYRAARAPADSVTAPAGGAVSAPVFAFRRKGLDDFCTCTEERYAELSAKPNLFETRIFYTTPPAQAADSVLEDAARLDWLLLRISGAEFRRLGVHYSGNARRADVDAARKQVGAT